MTTLAELQKRMNECRLCNLCQTRKNVVFGEGNTNSPKIMIVGEAPGVEEDETGRPFVGPAGKKLDRIIEYLGVPRDSLYITNAVLCRPPNNRPPTTQELAACANRLKEQILLIKPSVVICLGAVATTQVLGPFKGPLKQFFIGKLIDAPLIMPYNNDAAMATIKVFVTYHPSYHLRNPKKAYQETLPHWKFIKELLCNNQNI